MGSSAFVTEVLGDGRTWDYAYPENAITGWPLLQEHANLAILNNSATKTVRINTVNIRPYSGPQGTTPGLTMSRITALTYGEDCTVTSLDSENAALPSQVLIRYHPQTTTTVAGTTHRRHALTYTGFNIDRAFQPLCSKLQGFSYRNMDRSEMGRWIDSGVQKPTFREGEGFCLCCESNSGSNVYIVRIIFKDTSTGATYYVNQMIEPLFVDGAPIIGFLNGTGSGAVYELYRVQIAEVGDDQIPMIDFLAIDNVETLAENAQVVWADSNDSIPTDVLIKKQAFISRAGYRRGAVLVKPRFRMIQGGEPPYGPGIAGGPQICRRGKYAHDFRNAESSTALVLRRGEGIAVISRNPSASMYAELVANISVEDSGGGEVYPSQDDVRTGETYGPTGADYTGNLTLPSANDARVSVSYGTSGAEVTGTIVLPSANDARLGVSFGALSAEVTGTIELPSATSVLLGVSYGANGTEVTGTLAGGAGGGNRIFYPHGISGG